MKGATKGIFEYVRIHPDMTSEQALGAHSHFSGHAAIIERGELAIFFNRFHLPAL